LLLLVLVLLVLVLLVLVLLLLELSLHVLLLLLLVVLVLLVLVPIGLLRRLTGLRLVTADRTDRLVQQFAYSIVFRRFFQLYSRVKSL